MEMTTQQAVRILDEQRNKFMDEWVDFGNVNEAYNMAIALLKEQKTIVHCKDCKHWVTENDIYGECEQWHLKGMYFSDWFCADGEKNDENG